MLLSPVVVGGWGEGGLFHGADLRQASGHKHMCLVIVCVCVCLCLFAEARSRGWCLQTQLFVNMFVFVFVYVPGFVNTDRWLPPTGFNPRVEIPRFMRFMHLLRPNARAIHAQPLVPLPWCLGGGCCGLTLSNRVPYSR